MLTLFLCGTMGGLSLSLAGGFADVALGDPDPVLGRDVVGLGFDVVGLSLMVIRTLGTSRLDGFPSLSGCDFLFLPDFSLSMLRVRLSEASTGVARVRSTLADFVGLSESVIGGRS